MIKKQLIILFLFFNGISVLHASAQQNHFIYIQADDKQPFYVELNNKLYNSTDIGYLIISRLIGGEYHFTVGFPQEKYPSQSFTCIIDKKDMGYALKTFGDKGWGLVNFQSSVITMAGETPQNAAVKADSIKANPFGQMLSDVVDDSTLTTQVAINVPAEVKNQPDSTTNTTAVTTGIIKASAQASDQGTEMVFIDFNAQNGDTIKIFIPAVPVTPQVESSSPGTKDTVAAGISQSLPQDSAGNIIPANNNGNPFFNKSNSLDTVLVTNPDNNTAVTGSSAGTQAPAASFKQDCTKMISENDIDKLKRKMFTASDNEQMTDLAKKYITGKCITTDQVKSVIMLFSTDEGRYNFLDAVYKSTYDYPNFPLLENQLIDPYYRKRFEAMLK